MNCRACHHTQDSHTPHGCRDCTAYGLCYGFNPRFFAPSPPCGNPVVLVLEGGDHEEVLQ